MNNIFQQMYQYPNKLHQVLCVPVNKVLRSLPTVHNILRISRSRSTGHSLTQEINLVFLLDSFNRRKYVTTWGICTSSLLRIFVTNLCQ